MLEFEVKRHAGHPWDGKKRPNFDLLEVAAPTRRELDSFIAHAENKFWAIWVAGIVVDAVPPNAYGGILYKPSGLMSEWTDFPEQPHPGGQPEETKSKID